MAYEAIGQIDVDDIDHVNVLKGDYAKEQYGDRGANGVIEITTKQGSATKALPRRTASGVDREELEQFEVQTADAIAGGLEPPLYIYMVDGKTVSLETYSSIPKESQKGSPSVMVIKAPDSEQARKSLVDEYGPRAIHGVVVQEIFTKK